MHVRVREGFALVLRIQLASGIIVLGLFTLYSWRGIMFKKRREHHQDSQWKNLIETLQRLEQRRLRNDLNDALSHVLGHGELCISTAESLACISKARLENSDPRVIFGVDALVFIPLTSPSAIV